MTSLVRDEDGSGGDLAEKVKTAGALDALGLRGSGSGWTETSCPCCRTDKVEPLVLIQLGEQVSQETKTWIIKLIGAPGKEGGAALLAHPGEDAAGDIIVVSAPRCSLMMAADSLGLWKADRHGNMAAFCYQDRDNFKDSDDMEAFLTLAERQYIVKYELDGLRAQRDIRVPGVSAGLTLQRRDNIWQKLQKAGVVTDMFPIHDQRKLSALGNVWYSGNQLLQPLDAVHSYFGGTIAFYFSFLDFYTWSLLPPAVLGLALTFFSGAAQKKVLDSVSGSEVNRDEDEDEDEPSVSGYMVQAVFSMLWSTLVLELWKRRSSSLAYRWGSGQLAERFAEPRPGFHGDLGVNPVTGRTEPLFPDWLRQLRVALVSIPVVFLFLGLVVLGMFGFYWGESQVKWIHEDWDSVLSLALTYVPSILHILYTNVLSTVFRTVALSLTEWENHREETAFQNHHTAKVLLFTFFNYFAVLFHVAFYKQDLPLLRKRLASLLIISQLVNQVTEVVVPFLVDRLIAAPHRSQREDDPQEDQLRSQRNLPTFPGLFAEYVELLVQFGFISLFSCVFPLTGVLLLLNNLTEIRSDAYKICCLFRKPFSQPAEGIGVWQTAFEILSFVSVVSNCWLLLLSPRLREFCQEGVISSRNLILLAILVEHILILIKMIVAFLIPDEPDWIRTKRRQMEFRSMQALGQQKL